jgi:hypothetical protein
MLGKVDAQHVELIGVPTAYDVEAKPALANDVGRHHLLCRGHRVEQRDVNGAEGHDIVGAG